jgi:ribosomal protein S18 acetylase RimI-like enzyme
MYPGIGRALVEDAVARAADEAASWLEVIAGPATGFYEKHGFAIVAEAQDPVQSGGENAP